MYSTTSEYPCNDCDIYRQNIQLGANMGIEVYRFQKFIVLSLTLVKIFDFLEFLRGIIHIIC